MDDFFDDDLMSVMGDRYIPEDVPVAKFEPTEQSNDAITDFPTDIWRMVKFPLLFLSLILFTGWAANADLMDAIVAVPGMCVCSACFGWSVKK